MTITDSTAPRSLGKTADGVAIVEGLPVITNEMRVGVVRTDRYRASDDGWFDVEYAPDESGHARRVMQNGERVATRFTGFDGKTLVAEDEWLRQMFPCQECGHNCAGEANAAAQGESFEFKCPNCGLVDHI